MTVDQPLNVMLFHHPHDRLRIDVHDGHGFAAVGGFTARAHSGGDAVADKERQGKEHLLDPRGVDFGAKRR